MDATFKKLVKEILLAANFVSAEILIGIKFSSYR
jgi:hypothetical protein